MKKLKRDLTKPEKVEVKKPAVKKTAIKHQDEYPEGPEFEWADYWFEGVPETEVIKGDNLTKISKMYNVPVDSLIKWNGIKNPDKLKIGEVIKLSKQKKKKPAITRWLFYCVA